jgi:hypothetical protein
MIVRQLRIRSSPIAAALSFLICLSSWSIGSTIGSGSDMDYHASSIWCAWGEKPGLCEGKQLSDTDGIMYASVPYLFQMCNGRPIDFFPRCEKVDANSTMQELRTAQPQQSSVYYKIMHVFSSTNPNMSIIFMRLFNAAITSFVLFLILQYSTNKTRLAGLTAWTFTIVPTAFLKFASINPRGWSLLGAMTSWIFLHEALKAPTLKSFRSFLIWASFIFTALLAATTRIDSLIFVLFTSCLILLQHFVRVVSFNKKRMSIFILVTFCLGFVLRSIDRLGTFLNFRTPQGTPVLGYLYYASTRIPEAISEIWGYEVGQSGNGPPFTGIIGLLLFVLALYISLRFANSRQMIIVSVALLFLVAVNYWGLTSIGLQAQGHYSAALAAFLLGVSVLFSNNKEFFMKSKTTRNLAIGMLGYSHAVAFYSYMDLYVTGGENEGVIKSLPLRGWWWNSWSDPNWVLLIGIVAFPVSMYFAWSYVVNSELE